MILAYFYGGHKAVKFSDSRLSLLMQYSPDVVNFDLSNFHGQLLLGYEEYIYKPLKNRNIYAKKSKRN